MRNEPTDRDRFFHQMGQEKVNAFDALKILHLAQKAQNLAVKQCNEPWTDRDERARERVETRLAEICNPYGITADVHGDPRGYCVKLHLKSGAHNTWGGESEGYGVPARG